MLMPTGKTTQAVAGRKNVAITLRLRFGIRLVPSFSEFPFLGDAQNSNTPWSLHVTREWFSNVWGHIQVRTFTTHAIPTRFSAVRAEHDIQNKNTRRHFWAGWIRRSNTSRAPEKTGATRVSRTSVFVQKMRITAGTG